MLIGFFGNPQGLALGWHQWQSLWFLVSSVMVAIYTGSGCKRERSPDLCASYTHHLWVVSPKIQLWIWSSLQSNCIFTSNTGAEGHVKGHFRNSISNEKLEDKQLGFFHKWIARGKKRYRQGTYRLKEIQETYELIILFSLYLNPNSHKWTTKTKTKTNHKGQEINSEICTLTTVDNITRNTVQFLGVIMALWSCILRVLIF